MGKPKPAPEFVGLPEWMATFADMVTLLLTFFVLLLSFANQDVQKFRDVMGSIQGALGVRVERPKDKFMAVNPSLTESKGEAPRESRLLQGLSVRIKTAVETEKDLQRSSSVAADDIGVRVRFDSAAMFRGDSAELTPEGRRFLDLLVGILREYKFNLVVRGHTDNQSHASRAYPTNWELSAARASAAVRYVLENGGIAANRVKAVGYADTRPAAPNTTAEGRARNNRVEFYVYRPTVDAW